MTTPGGGGGGGWEAAPGGGGHCALMGGGGVAVGTQFTLYVQLPTKGRILPQFGVARCEACMAALIRSTPSST